MRFARRLGTRHGAGVRSPGRISVLRVGSCAPNCDRFALLNDSLKVVALRPIKAGEILTANYLPFEGLLSGFSVAPDARTAAVLSVLLLVIYQVSQ